jgi:E3 ubiquitin-protein ligase TRAF7
VNLENQLASVSSDRTLRLWDLTTGQDRILYTGTSTELLDVTYSASRKLLFASTYDANIICLDPRDSRLVATLSGHNWEGKIETMNFATISSLVWQLECDDHVLLSGSFDHTIKRWDIRQFQNSATLRGHHGINFLARLIKYLFQVMFMHWRCEQMHCIRVVQTARLK